MQAHDAAAYRSLRIEALTRHPDAFTTTADEAEAVSAEKMAARFGGPGRDDFVMGAFSPEGHLAGFAGFERETRAKLRHKGRVIGVFVSPALRGQGAGRALMDALLARARSLDGLTRIVLSVTEGNEAATALYTSCGFISYGVEPDALRLGDDLHGKRLMTLELRPPE